VLEGFPTRAEDLRRALEVARRLELATEGRVEAVRSVTPADYEVRLRVLAGSDRKVVVHVRPDVTDGERFWCERAASGAPVASWADLRWQDRVVIGGGR
jgi:hypothetical protein